MDERGADNVTPFATAADDDDDKFGVKLTSLFQHTPFTQRFTIITRPTGL